MARDKNKLRRKIIFRIQRILSKKYVNDCHIIIFDQLQKIEKDKMT